MWGFVDCTRYYMSEGRPRVVLHNASLLVETREKVALLTRPGHGKSSIMRMLAGIDLPNAGTVLRDEGGWPLGYAGGFHIDMSGDANIRNLARIADVDPIELTAFCYEFSELEDFYYQPVRLYSSTMRARLAFAASLGLPAKTYLADDKLSAGDDRFRDKCMTALTAKLSDAGLIFVASNPRQAREICDRFYVLSGGQFLACDDYDEALERLSSSAEDDDAGDSADHDLPTFDLA
jgi:capsular polysaccharide transport system ATP-binding protein